MTNSLIAKITEQGQTRGYQFITTSREEALRKFGQYVNANNSPYTRLVLHLPPRWWPCGNCRPAYLSVAGAVLFRRRWFRWVPCGELSE